MAATVKIVSYPEPTWYFVPSRRYVTTTRSGTEGYIVKVWTLSQMQVYASFRYGYSTLRNARINAQALGLVGPIAHQCWWWCWLRVFICNMKSRGSRHICCPAQKEQSDAM